MAFSAPTLRPVTAPMTISAASAMRRGPIISPMKSKYPGMSMKLIFVSFHSTGATAVLMENWRRISSGS